MNLEELKSVITKNELTEENRGLLKRAEENWNNFSLCSVQELSIQYTIQGEPFINSVIKDSVRNISCETFENIIKENIKTKELFRIEHKKWKIKHICKEEEE